MSIDLNEIQKRYEKLSQEKQQREKEYEISIEKIKNGQKIQIQNAERDKKLQELANQTEVEHIQEILKYQIRKNKKLKLENEELKKRLSKYEKV